MSIPPKKNAPPPLGTQSYGGRASPCKSTGGGCMGFFGESRRQSRSAVGVLGCPRKLVNA